MITKTASRNQSPFTGLIRLPPSDHHKTPAPITLTQDLLDTSTLHVTSLPSAPTSSDPPASDSESFATPHNGTACAFLCFPLCRSHGTSSHQTNQCHGAFVLHPSSSNQSPSSSSPYDVQRPFLICQNWLDTRTFLQLLLGSLLPPVPLPGSLIQQLHHVVWTHLSNTHHRLLLTDQGVPLWQLLKTLASPRRLWLFVLHSVEKSMAIVQTTDRQKQRKRDRAFLARCSFLTFKLFLGVTCRTRPHIPGIKSIRRTFLTQHSQYHFRNTLFLLRLDIANPFRLLFRS